MSNQYPKESDYNSQ